MGRLRSRDEPRGARRRAADGIWRAVGGRALQAPLRCHRQSTPRPRRNRPVVFETVLADATGAGAATLQARVLHRRRGPRIPGPAAVRRNDEDARIRIGLSIDTQGVAAKAVARRALLTRIEDWQAVASVHGEFFGAIRPANTVMQVSRFIDPRSRRGVSEVPGPRTARARRSAVCEQLGHERFAALLSGDGLRRPSSSRPVDGAMAGPGRLRGSAGHFVRGGR